MALPDAGRAHVTFRRKHDWALVPVKQAADRVRASTEAELYTRSFRWVRKHRAAAACWPWRIAHEVGWIISSPIDILMTPINDTEVSVPPEELELFSTATNLSELWKRENSAIAVEKTNWLRLYDFRVAGGWETMFVPNGEGTVEWHLGWELDIPDGYYVLILPAPATPPGVEVPMGILDAKAVKRLNERQGMAIAIRPRQPTRLQRGQPIARLVLLHRDSISCTSTSEL